MSVGRDLNAVTCQPGGPAAELAARFRRPPVGSLTVEVSGGHMDRQFGPGEVVG